MALPTLRQLRYLVALDEHRHFGRAAESCCATQSTLSAGLQELEGLLGATLVERTKRRVMLTPLGEDIAARARALLLNAQEIADLAAAAQGPLSAPLRLGVIPTIAPYLLPRVLPDLRQRHAGLKLYLREDQTARLLDLLGAGDLDAALLALPFDTPDFETRPLFEDAFVLACPANHPLAERPRIATRDLIGEPLLLLEEGHCLRQHALAACRLPGPARGEGVLATSLATLVQMVANGLGLTLLPEMALAAGILAGTDVVTRPLIDPSSRTIALVWRPSCPRKEDFHALGAAIAAAGSA